MPDRLDVFFGAALGVGSQRIHSDVHVRTDILVPEPLLKILAGCTFRRRDPLNRFTRSTAPYQHCNTVGRFKVLKDVVRSGQGIRSWLRVGVHNGSRSLEKTAPKSYSSRSGSYPLIATTWDTNPPPGPRSSCTTTFSEWPIFVLMAR